jgi:hypothetical protein
MLFFYKTFLILKIYTYPVLIIMPYIHNPIFELINLYFYLTTNILHIIILFMYIILFLNSVPPKPTTYKSLHLSHYYQLQ